MTESCAPASHISTDMLTGEHRSVSLVEPDADDEDADAGLEARRLHLRLRLCGRLDLGPRQRDRCGRGPRRVPLRAAQPPAASHEREHQRPAPTVVRPINRLLRPRPSTHRTSRHVAQHPAPPHPRLAHTTRPIRSRSSLTATHPEMPIYAASSAAKAHVAPRDLSPPANMCRSARSMLGVYLPRTRDLRSGPRLTW